MNEKAMEYTDVLNARLNKVQQDFDQQLLSIDRLATENTQKAAELKAEEDKINGLRQETLHQSAMVEAIQRKLRAIEYQKIEVEQREETLKKLRKGNWNDDMKRECLSFLKLDRSQTCLAFPFLSSRVAPRRQSHFNRDFACRFKGINKVNYNCTFFPSIILLSMLSLLYNQYYGELQFMQRQVTNSY